MLIQFIKDFSLRMVAFIVVLSCSQCGKKNTQEGTRSFYMAVTPWPADFTGPAVDSAYQFIHLHCDMVSHHFDDGIAYEQALRNLPMPVALQQNILERKTKTASSKKVLLSISALDLSRRAKADYYRDDNSVTDSIKQKWKNLPFNHPDLISAYTNFVSWLIDQLNPTYVNYGVESNEAGWSSSEFDLYKQFISQVYARLKLKYSSLPIMISFMVTEQPQSLALASQLLPYTDYLALSAYPYTHVSSSASGNTDPNLFPADYFMRYINLAPAKPFAFAETGYIAENLVISSFNLNKQGNEEWQQQYLEKICQLLTEKKGKFLVWFCSKDYDAASIRLQQLGLYMDLFGLWEDTGLIDETGKLRKSYNSWLKWQSIKKSE